MTGGNRLDALLNPAIAPFRAQLAFSTLPGNIGSFAKSVDGDGRLDDDEYEAAGDWRPDGGVVTMNECDGEDGTSIGLGHAIIAQRTMRAERTKPVSLAEYPPAPPAAFDGGKMNGSLAASKRSGGENNTLLLGRRC